MLTEDQLAEMSDEELEEVYLKEKGLKPSDDESQEEQSQDNQDDETSTDPEPNVEQENETTENLDNQNDEVEVKDESASEENQETEEKSNDENQDESTEEGTQSEQTEDSETTTPGEIELPALKASGREIPVSSLEELYSLAAAGFDYTKKTQEIAPFRKAVAMMKDNGISEKDISLYIEAKKGNKDAIATLIKEAGVDPIDLEEEPNTNYQPGAYIPDDSEVRLKEVQAEISRDPEYVTTANVVNNLMDQESQEMMYKDPNLIRGIHEDIKSGAYDQVIPQAEKLRVMDGGRRPLMEYYIQAAQMVFPPQEKYEPPVHGAPNVTQPNVGSQEPNQEVIRKRIVDTSRKKAASPTRAKVPPKKVIDVDEMSDEELMKMREDILSRY